MQIVPGSHLNGLKPEPVRLRTVPNANWKKEVFTHVAPIQNDLFI
jgi:hypothetical protein